jgi:GWxTD domain-containing protein
MSLSGTGQTIDPTSPFILNVDFSRFKNNDTTGYVELYYLFYPGLVTVERGQENTLTGKIMMQVKAREAGSGDIVLNEMRVLPVEVADSAQLASSNTIVSLSGYVLPFGVYEFNVIASDSLNMSRTDSLSFTVTISGLSDATSVSDLELCSRIEQATGQGSFVKNTLEVVPNATLMYGVTNHPVVFHYIELYNLSTDVEYYVASSVLDATGTQLRLTSRRKTYTVQNAVDVGTMNVTSLPSGRYIYQVAVLEDSVKEVARTRKVFYVYNPHIKIETASTVSLKASELAGLDFDELGTEFEAASYLANSDDVDTFEKLTTADARREFLASYWTSIESGKDGRPPISRAEYKRRVQTATQRYRLHNRPGWKSDRGRVYLLYGEPDEFERVPNDEQVKPHEIWYYYGIENGVQFIFIDRTGFGDYILVHSTKRGELQDASWQRMLR